MFKTWNIQFTRMFNECERMKEACLKVYYERLVQQTAKEARRILKFLGVPWSEDVLRHQDKIGKEVKLNPIEYSTSQVKEKIYKKALTSWFGYFPDNILNDINTIAPMLRQLGYDTSARKPSYAKFAEDDFYEKWNNK
ncbi:hypothetical protein ANCCAN_11298 [Ancylostoma caninum]|uniref:Protein-tyrosine sulfotransferase n=1 Tax=Ancylostoma caninum TaxID=29170 RepID=A0A368GI65_ANCCA|nr:hypothetical protein ANCCAN_11298 [Ancylostoma caninum]